MDAGRSRAEVMRDGFNATLEPLARRLGWVHPNTMSVVALLIGVAAGVCLGLGDRVPPLYAVAGLLVALSGVLDGLDGVMARLHDRTSRLGDFLDHVFDRLVEVALFGGLAVSPRSDPILGLVVLVVILLNGYLGTQIQASFGRRFYSGLGKAELVAGFAVGTVFLAFQPAFAVPLFGRAVPLVDVFLMAVGVLTLLAAVHRVSLAVRLAAGDAGGGG